MVNFGLNFISVVGLFDVLGGIGYFILIITQVLESVRKSNSSLYIILKVLELLFCPIALLLSGGILIFNGWRLDPILQFQQLLFHLIVIVCLVKEAMRSSVSLRR
ncbi:Ycf66 family protein [Pleurocapsa sp. PCC 7319]|uniref:Ycf66 family protein n=1 Tax=Pleurocapsa sp. PCC 7319 TaxID=118161 RepID=UPI0003478C8E|nr:Ycf66 family protein [Pleurocapsa sp. PCC 7319]